MRHFTDWRIWAGLLVLLVLTLYFVHISQRFQFDYSEFGRTTLVGMGYKKNDLHVSSMLINSSPFVGDEATVVFQVGPESNAKRVKVRMQRSVFGPPTVESIE